MAAELSIPELILSKSSTIMVPHFYFMSRCGFKCLLLDKEIQKIFMHEGLVP